MNFKPSGVRQRGQVSQVQRVTWNSSALSSVQGRVLTPVIQTSHHISLTVRDLLSPLTGAGDKNKNRGAVANCGGSHGWERLGSVFVVVHDYVNFNASADYEAEPPLFPPFHFCGFQQPVVLSHQPHLFAKKTPTKLYPPGQQRPHPDLPGHAPAKPCGLLQLGCSGLFPPAADSPSVLPLLLPLWVETRRSWLPRSEAAHVGSGWRAHAAASRFGRNASSLPPPPPRVETLISIWPKIHSSFISSVHKDQPEGILS